MRKEIIAIAVLTCLTLTSIQTVLADSSCPYGTPNRSGIPYCAIWGPFIAPGANSMSYSPFDADFIHLTGASVSFVGTTFTFTMTVYQTHLDWMQWSSSSPPTFAAPHTNKQLSKVGGNWIIVDSAKDSYVILHYAWNSSYSLTGTHELSVYVCPPRVTKNNSCWTGNPAGVGGGIGAYKTTFTSLTGDYSSKTLAVTISKGDLDSLFPTPATYWRAFTFACISGGPVTSGNECTGYVTYPLQNLPT